MTVPIFGLDFRAHGGRSGSWMPSRLLAANGSETGLSPERLSAYEPLVFLLHGFNVKRTSGIKTLHRFAKLLAQHGANPGALVSVTWPGDGFGGPFCYPAQEKDADDTAHYLARLLRERIRPRQPVSFVAHSLGSRVVFEAMDLLEGDAVEVGETVVMAAAVDCDAPARWDRYRMPVTKAERVTVLHSKKDTVLKYAFPPGDLVASLFYGGYTARALGACGPRDGRGDQRVPDNVARYDAKGAGHSDYLPGKSPNVHQMDAARVVAELLSDSAGALPAGVRWHRR